MINKQINKRKIDQFQICNYEIYISKKVCNKQTIEISKLIKDCETIKSPNCNNNNNKYLIK